jgi:peptide-methionine (R)-S-oxide reductase
MNRRDLLLRMSALAILPLLPAGCARGRDGTKLGEVGRDAEYWKPLLRPEQFEILFKEATERAGSSPLNHEKRPGTYICAACFLPLFSSTAKFDSGTGWPSFFQSLPKALGTRSDHSFGMGRTEYHCVRCGGHQGHVFDDGPPPTGQRYCNNGLALDFVPEGEKLPALRG